MNTRSESNSGTIRMPQTTVGAEGISVTPLVTNSSSKKRHTRTPMTNQLTRDPVSPRNILFFLPNTLKQKQAARAPINEKLNIVYAIFPVIQNQVPKTDAVSIPIPEASPSIPSIRLKPLIITKT